MSTGGKTVTGTPLQAWGIEVGGSVHCILFACAPHSLGMSVKSAEIAALAGAHDGQRPVRLPQLDVVPELAGRSSCFACRLDKPARPSTSTPARPLSTKEN